MLIFTVTSFNKPEQLKNMRLFSRAGRLSGGRAWGLRANELFGHITAYAVHLYGFCVHIRKYNNRPNKRPIYIVK